MQEIFREHSLYYQKREETIIGQVDRRKKFVNSLKRLRRKGSGIWTKELLRFINYLGCFKSISKTKLVEESKA